ncbi:hypothetical protein EAG18_02510 [Pseudoalteromonas sp. J010]|uniref:hypothetical protein n=1 Tax=Pseudoalteromonas sp. J010 TaxID=998465 RepID=UPI000F6543E4|nr:hypothetical protein [Pseudoalteromonas sp. J010]RRS10106.1 hypothetical protein EAG18_02510 [Pseudoalteromonas sp. J010]
MNRHEHIDADDEHEQARIMYYRACIAEFQQLGYQEALFDETFSQKRLGETKLNDSNSLQNE